MHAVLLDINSKQRFIFTSPRLRESIGASHLITLLETWATEALTQQDAHDMESAWVSRSSGRVILTVDDEQRARDVIRDVTLRALCEAPGMDVSGVFVQMAGDHFSADDLGALNDAAAEYAVQRPPADGRFSRLPFLAGARESVLLAAPPLGIAGESPHDAREAYSLPSRVKRHAADAARKNLLNLVRAEKSLHDEDDRLVTDQTRLERMLQPEEGDEHEDDARALSKIGVVHVDGNGVGAVMRDLPSAMGRVTEDDFAKAVGCAPADVDALRKFILAVNRSLDEAVRTAFRKAWADVARWAESDAEKTGGHVPVPVVPVLLGGDDVTVITSGDYALPFATSYLHHYEAATATDDLLKYLGGSPGATGPMTAAAGVAVVRFAFPFHIAYELAEQLVDQAKELGRKSTPPVSTLTHHVLFDTTVADPEGLLQSYEGVSNRPFTLDGGPAGLSGLAGHESWPAICQQVADFKGQISRNNDDREAGFPRTRAARIRTMMSDVAHARFSGDQAREHELLDAAEREWEAAVEACPGAAEQFGGMGAMFDLMELSDLLPDSYLRDPLGSAMPSGCSSEKTAHTTAPQGRKGGQA